MTASDSQTAFRPDYPIIDADVHIHEDPQELAEFSDGNLRLALESHQLPERWLDAPGYSPLTLFEPPLTEDVGLNAQVVQLQLVDVIDCLVNRREHTWDSLVTIYGFQE